MARLSIAQIAMTVSVRSSYRAVMWATLLPIAALVEGDAGRTTTNGSPLYLPASVASSDAVVTLSARLGVAGRQQTRGSAEPGAG